MVKCGDSGLLVLKYFYFFAPNTHCALVVALSKKKQVPFSITVRNVELMHGCFIHLPIRSICTTTYRIFIPMGTMCIPAGIVYILTDIISIFVGVMYLPAGILCTLTETITMTIDVMCIPAGMFCTLNATILLLVRSMCLPVDMFCTFTDTIYIPMCVQI